MKKFIGAGIGIILLFIISCVPIQDITNFEECAAAGNPVMESHPRQCRANGQVFVEQLLGGCGTVTPGLNDECCENVMKDVPHILCVGRWKWNFNTNACEYVCQTEEDNYKAILHKEDKTKRILCETDDDCTFEKLQGSYSELIIPSCSSKLSCKQGICMYSC